MVSRLAGSNADPHFQLEQFARYQPFTPVTETLRGLLTGTPIGNNGIAAVAWSAGIAIISYVWAMRLYGHRRAT